MRSRDVDDAGHGKSDRGGSVKGSGPPTGGDDPRREPTGLRRFLRSVSLSEIVKGLSLTMKHLFTPAVTRQYPKEQREPFEGSRGLHALVRNPETGEEVCVGCCLCAAMCPSECIDIYTSEGNEHEKVVDRYEIDTLRCVYCGLCVEACPYGAVVMTEHFAYSDYSKEAFLYDKQRLLGNWDRHFGDKKGKGYLSRFWKPKRSDFGARRTAANPEEDEG
jgi:NADH-quinone oxidoreductase subunit I